MNPHIFYESGMWCVSIRNVYGLAWVYHVGEFDRALIYAEYFSPTPKDRSSYLRPNAPQYG